ncbi:hypothetical protein [Asticcacaulis sp. AC402]|uniref:hypothetical protein n=1 Tax=Asticcacaulis sp. AC402 TaxID=1282361 RepID=UPI0003C406D3|nr:hypothetical protein [Asticcacaulis sp. AC402]ESQ74589.1 hypothetical protein ABAC402_13170 [Asticcacaulis sp. AC402]
MDRLKLRDTLLRLFLANGLSLLVCLAFAGLKSLDRDGGFQPILIVIYLGGQGIVLAADVFFYNRRRGNRFISSRR